ncbi:DUF5000 domain-containing lipoprotein [Alistipes sp.]|uniref:DUF5000 domain-containing lipoprotein n=1 Tax=Alistipes sp. TaxID=1872444 RepID=UPI0025C6C779|nr:DUF5000 domain-containing lipoprotein [Alistipes sp.]
MKRIYSILTFLALAGGVLTSCDQDAKFSTYIPTHALHEMVRSAKATCGEETVTGAVDNNTHAIKFVFVSDVDFSKVKVVIDYASRTVLKEGAFTEQEINLTTPYTFVLNNLEEDFTYTISVDKALVAEVDRAQCAVLAMENDAVYDDTAPGQAGGHIRYCFDGKRMSKKEAYGEVGYNFFGWTMKEPAPEGHGNSFTFDVGEPMRLSKMLIWPYWPYNNNAPAIYEIYAYTLPGEPTGDWANWVKIADVDDSDKWEIVKNAQPGSAEDLTTQGTTIEFKFGDVPETRYYRLKMVKNFYAAFGEAMNANWKVRQNWFTLSEIELWRYNISEKE